MLHEVVAVDTQKSYNLYKIGINLAVILGQDGRFGRECVAIF